MDLSIRQFRPLKDRIPQRVLLLCDEALVFVSFLQQVLSFRGDDNGNDGLALCNVYKSPLVSK